MRNICDKDNFGFYPTRFGKVSDTNVFVLQRINQFYGAAALQSLFFLPLMISGRL